MIQAVPVIAVSVGGNDQSATQQIYGIRDTIGTAIDVRMRDRSVILVLDIVQLQISVEIVGGVPLQGHTADEILEAFGAPDAAIRIEGGRTRCQLHIIFNILILRSNADTQSVADRTGYMTPDCIAVFLKLVGALARHFPFLRRIGRAYGNHAGRSTFTEEKRLRPFQDIDLLDIEKAGLHHAHRADLNAVEIEGNSGIKSRRNIGRANPAQTDLTTGTGPPDLHIERRHAADHVSDFVDLKFVQRIAANSGDGHRHFLQCLCLLAGNHGDDGGFIDLLGILRHGRRGKTRKGETGSGSQQKGSRYFVFQVGFVA